MSEQTGLRPYDGDPWEAWRSYADALEVELAGLRYVLYTLMLAEQYLSHPDVQAIPFAMNANTAEERVRRAIAKVTGND